MKDIALSEITLRKYEKPHEADKRNLIKKICLSLGLLQPGDSRDIIVDVLYCIVNKTKKGECINVDELKQSITELRKTYSLPLSGLADSNLRRQLKRLRDMMIIEKTTNGYRLRENNTLKEIFNDTIKPFYIDQIIARINDYLDELEK